MQKTIRPREIMRQRNRRLMMVTASIVAIGLFAFVYRWHRDREWVSTDDAFITGHLITVVAQTEGAVVEVLTENTLYVERGQLLVRLDGVRAKIDLQQARAELGTIVRDIVALAANVETLQQRIVARQAVLDRIKHDLVRLNGAASEGAVSQQRLQNAKDRSRQLHAEIAAIRAEKKAVEGRLLNESVDTHPAVERAKSRLRRAFLNYRRRHVVAPVSGYVAKRKVQVGESVEAGTPLLVIVPLNELWVEANLLETKIARVRPGQQAEIQVDAYAGERLYHGVVEGVNPGTGSVFALLPSDNASGNFIHIAERVPVRIALDPEELKRYPLQPGLSTITRINVSKTQESMLDSKTKPVTEYYRTEIFENELAGVEHLIDDIIKANKPALK